jgi:hypothetical protein
MSTWNVVLGVVLAGALAGSIAGCAESNREWMKVNDRYTVEEFRRDHADCSKGGRLDDGCMRSRGWVDVSPKGEKPPDLSDRGQVRPRAY